MPLIVTAGKFMLAAEHIHFIFALLFFFFPNMVSHFLLFVFPFFFFIFSIKINRTPLHCAASCNNVQVCKFLVESGAAVFAMTYSDMQTAADKCEEMEEGYTQCSQFLYGQ